jgi:hypothetical protein
MIFMDLDKLLDLAELHARMVLFKRRQALPPTWILSDGKEMRKVFTPWKTDLERELTKGYIANLIKQYNTVAYCVISEVWVAKDTQENYESKNYIQPRHRPDRQEMVFALATNGTSVQNRQWQIVRDWHERIIKLEPQKMQAYEGFGGWMVGLLGEPTEFI